jgi:hypothetical protein
VPLRQQGDEHALEHLVLPGDHAPDLEEGLLQPLLRLGGRQGRLLGRLLGHANAPLLQVAAEPNT